MSIVDNGRIDRFRVRKRLFIGLVHIGVVVIFFKSSIFLLKSSTRGKW